MLSEIIQLKTKPTCDCPVVAPVIDLFYVCEVIKHDKVILAQDELELFEWARPNAKHLENMAFESNKLALEKWLELN